MDHTRHICIIFLLILASTSTIQGQTTKISGIVLSDKKEPLPGANIYIEGTYEGVSSATDGSFSFKTQITGSQHLIVNYIGYESFNSLVECIGRDIYLEIKLTESFNQLKAVSITAGSFEASDTRKSVVLNSLDIVTTAGALGDVPGALQTLPGTTPVGESGRLYVRGGHSSETQTFIDGNLVHEPYTTSTPNTAVRGRFNPFMFAGTIFSTGGYSAEYGQALSSVLLLKTKGIPEEDQLDLSFMTIGGGLAGTKRWNRGALTASLDYMNLTPYMLLVPQNRDFIKYPESINGALSLRKMTGKDGLLRTYITYDRSNTALNEENPNFPNGKTRFDIHNQYMYFNTSWLGSLSETWSLKIGLSTTYNRNDENVGFGNMNNNLLGTNLKIVLAKQLHQKVRFRFGSEYNYRDYGEQLYIDTLNMDTKFEVNNRMLSGFTEADIYFSNNIMARIGGRYEYSFLLDKYNLAPRLSIAYKTGKSDQLSLAYGRFYQDPSNEHLKYDQELIFEQAQQILLNYQFMNDRYTFRAELYYKKYDNLVKYDLSDYQIPQNHNNNGMGYSFGLDIFWRDKQTIPNGDYWISYSYVNSKRNYLNFPNESQPSYVSRHNVSLVYKQWLNALRSQIGVTMKYSSPRFYDNPNNTEFNSEKMAPFRTVNLNWSFLYRQYIILYAAITNIFGFKNSYGYTYASLPDSAGEFEAMEIKPEALRFYFIGCFITLTKRGDSNQLYQIF